MKIMECSRMSSAEWYTQYKLVWLWSGHMQFFFEDKILGSIWWFEKLSTTSSFQRQFSRIPNNICQFHWIWNRSRISKTISLYLYKIWNFRDLSLSLSIDFSLNKKIPKISDCQKAHLLHHCTQTSNQNCSEFRNCFPKQSHMVLHPTHILPSG